MTGVTTLQLPKPTENHQQLGAFIGMWHAEGSSYADGQQAADPLASAVPWRSDESYKWLPGGFFVLHRWDAMTGARVFKAPRSSASTEMRADFSLDTSTTQAITSSTTQK